MNVTVSYTEDEPKLLSSSVKYMYKALEVEFIISRKMLIMINGENRMRQSMKA